MELKTFKHDLMPPLPSISVKYYSGERYYKCPTTSLWYPSVTTVLGHKKKKFFENWRTNPDNAKKLIHSQNRGNDFHSIIENYIKNDYQKSKNETANSLFSLLKPKIDKIDNVVAQEIPLWSDYLKLAGRVDCIGYYNNVMSVIDFKGSTEPKKEEWINDYFCQAAIYCLMFEERFNQKIKQIVILVASEDGITQEFIKNPKNYFSEIKNNIDEFWKTHDFNEIQEKLNGDIL